MNRKLGGGGIIKEKSLKRMLVLRGVHRNIFFRIQMICLEDWGRGIKKENFLMFEHKNEYSCIIQVHARLYE